MTNHTLCILTDNTAQLPHGPFPGQRLINILPMLANSGKISVPPLEDFLRIYGELEHEFSNILVLTVSSHILPAAQMAQKAALQHGGTVQIKVLDSKQTGAGLGMLAQLGAQAILSGATLTGLEEYLRATIASIYTLIHIDAQSLAHAAFSPPKTETESGLLPLLTLEDGQLVPYKKIRTRRHLLESFQEFIEEFETPQQIACLSGRDSAIRPRSLRDIATNNFPGIPFTDLDLPAPLMRLFGPETVGITIMEPRI